MKLHINRTREPNLKGWCLRALLGPASMLDGLVWTVTLGSAGFGFTLSVARRVSINRMTGRRT